MYEGLKRSVAFSGHVREMRRLNRTDAALVRLRQEQKLRSLLGHAVSRSPYYREVLRGFDLQSAPLSSLPVLSKRTVMDRFDDVVTDARIRQADVRAWLSDASNVGKVYLDKYVPFHTSGSSGAYSLCIYTPEEVDYYYASLVARPVMTRPLPARLKEAFRRYFVQPFRLAVVVMPGAPSHALAHYLPPFASRSWNVATFSILDPFAKLVSALEAFRPDALIVYPSLLGTLAREKLAGRLELPFDSLFSYIATSGESLSDDVRQLTKRAWGLDVQDSYNMCECFVAGRMCEQGGRLHVMEDSCILEIVDENNQPVPDGEMGHKLLVTNLFNFTQPFIRYEVTDVTGYDTAPCNCGWPFRTLRRIEGRSYDTFYLNRASGGYEPVHPYRFATPIFQLGEEVSQSQLIQTASDVLLFRYVPAKGGDVEARIRAVFQECFQKNAFHDRVRVEFERVSAIDRDATSGKYRQFINQIGRSHNA